jgi:hypothetical protein
MSYWRLSVTLFALFIFSFTTKPNLRNVAQAGQWWFIPAILATQEAEIRRTVV